MRQSTYDHIKENIHLLEIDYENGVILNRNERLRKGYKSVKFKQKEVTVHNVIAFIKFGEKTIDFEINHIDGKKINNRPENLEVVTKSENAIHAFSLGLRKNNRKIGELSGTNKLNNRDVSEIRKLLNQGVKHRIIAKKFNVATVTINRISARSSWAHLE